MPRKALAAAVLAAAVSWFAAVPATASAGGAVPVKWVPHGSHMFERDCAAAGTAQPKQFTCTREFVEAEYRWVLWIWEPGIEVRSAAVPPHEAQERQERAAPATAAPGTAQSTWRFEYRYYRHNECVIAGSNGVPRSWTAYQCRTIDLGGEVYAWDLWVCHDRYQCDLTRRAPASE
ncbi:hypothetical protein OG216_40100 [Streptomycetaceae bacterium NBC_01309]